MRILHTSDWHLGKNFFSKKLTEVQRRLFEEEFFHLVKDVQPDLVLVTGDVVDKPAPDYETLELLKDILLFLGKNKVKSIFILGNHDSKRVSLYKEFFKELGIMFVDDLEGLVSPIEVCGDSQDRVWIYSLPYMNFYELKERSKTLSQGLFKGVMGSEISFLRDAVKWVVKNTCVYLKRPCIFLGHFAVDKGFFSGEETSLTTVGMEEIIPSEVVKDFDLVCLGHLHRAQKLGNKIFYSGSPMPYSFEESRFKKGVWLFELKAGKLVNTEFVELSPPVEIKVKKGKFEELLFSKPDEAFVKVVLTDKTPVMKPFERLKTVFPNLLVLEYEEDFEGDELPEVEFKSVGSLSLNEKELFESFLEFLKVSDKAELVTSFVKVLEEFKQEKEALMIKG